MSGFEVHPIGTRKRLAELEALLAAQAEPVRREDLRVGDRVRIVSEAVLATIDECGESWDGNSPHSSTTYYLLDRPDPLAAYLRGSDWPHLVADLVAALRSPDAPPVKEPEPVPDEALVKVVVDWLHSPEYDKSEEDDARDLIRRLYAKAVQS